MSDLDKLTAELRKLQIDRKEWRDKLNNYGLSRRYNPRRMVLRRMVHHYARMLQETDQQIEKIRARIAALPNCRTHIDQAKYQDSDLLVQPPDWCVAYAAFNNLIMQGERISEEKASTDSRGFAENMPYKTGIDFQAAPVIFKNYGFRTVIFMALVGEFWQPPSMEPFRIQRRAKNYTNETGDMQSEALRNLTRKVKKANRPIYVLVSTGFDGDPNSNHAMNVVGGLFDTNDELKYIIIYTNWGKDYRDGGYRIISVDAFFLDWQRYGYFMMTAA